MWPLGLGRRRAGRLTGSTGGPFTLGSASARFVVRSFAWLGVRSSERVIN